MFVSGDFLTDKVDRIARQWHTPRNSITAGFGPFELGRGIELFVRVSGSTLRSVAVSMRCTLTNRRASFIHLFFYKEMRHTVPSRQER